MRWKIVKSDTPCECGKTKKQIKRATPDWSSELTIELHFSLDWKLIMNQSFRVCARQEGLARGTGTGRIGSLCHLLLHASCGGRESGINGVRISFIGATARTNQFSVSRTIDQRQSSRNRRRRHSQPGESSPWPPATERPRGAGSFRLISFATPRPD